jgi:hypothetical protein
MKIIITNVQQFENLTKCSRGTSKQTIDSFIESYNITNDDLIADIYGSYGIDGMEEIEYFEPETKHDLNHVEILGIETYFNKFYNAYLNININAEFFYASGLLNSVDMANGIPLELEGLPISHLTINESGCVFVVCETENESYVYYSIETNGDFYLMK